MKGRIIFISGPSGVGKGTLITILKNKHKEWIFPPSYSTREPRDGEVNGDPYYFIKKVEFENKIKNKEFLEYALIHKKDFYGTDRNSLLIPAEKGKTVVKEFDVQGFEQILKKLPKERYISIFLNVSGGATELIERIKERGEIKTEELKKRIESMKKELKLKDLYDFVVFNDDKDKMVKEIELIISKNRK